MERTESTKILIVEDNASIRRCIQNALEFAGYVVDSAECVEDACLKLDEEVYDIILSDIFMDECDGLTFAKLMHEGHIHAVKIAMSGYPEVDQRALESGFNMFISKPFTEEDLLGIVSKAEHLS